VTREFLFICRSLVFSVQKKHSTQLFCALFERDLFWGLCRGPLFRLFCLCARSPIALDIVCPRKEARQKEGVVYSRVAIIRLFSPVKQADIGDT
jgi:hypothetical protein